MNMRDVAIVSFEQAPLDQPPGMTETTLLLPTITDALARVGLTRSRCAVHVFGERRLPHGRRVHVRADARSGRRVAADLRVARRDGRRVGAVRGVGAAAARRHRCRARVRIRSGRPQRVAAGDAHLAVRPVLPRAARYRLRVAVGVAGASGARRDRPLPNATSPTSSCGPGAMPRAAPPRPSPATSRSTTCSPRTTWSRRCASTTSAHRSTAPPRSCSSPATGPATSCERPAWIRGIDHRVDPHYPGIRDLATSASTDGRRRRGPVSARAASRWPS